MTLFYLLWNDLHQQTLLYDTRGQFFEGVRLTWLTSSCTKLTLSRLTPPPRDGRVFRAALTFQQLHAFIRPRTLGVPQCITTFMVQWPNICIVLEDKLKKLKKKLMLSVHSYKIHFWSFLDSNFNLDKTYIVFNIMSFAGKSLVKI